MLRSISRIAALLVSVSATLFAPGLALAEGHAEAREVTERVAGQWRRAGGRVTTLPTKFLFDDDKVVVPIAQEDATCTQIAIVGARGLSFRAKLSDAPRDPLDTPEPGSRSPSTAGVVELHRCEKDRPVRYIEVSSDAGRGAIEIVVARSSTRLPVLASLVPERTGGMIPPPPEAGPLPALVPQDRRAELAEQRARRDGGRIAARAGAHAGQDGTGETEIEVDEGCHRIEVFGRDLVRDRPGRRFRLDVDAEIRDGESLLARDRTEAPDARLEACVGRPTRLTAIFTGTVPGTEVLVTRATWPLPGRLPPMWGPTARSKMARVMWIRHVALPADDPVYLAQGASGTTPLPVPVEAGGCYVAVVGVTRGRARQLQLRSFVGGRESTDERGATEEAALTAFCVRGEESARLEVVARGTGVAWGVAVFRVKSGLWEAGR